MVESLGGRYCGAEYVKLRIERLRAPVNYQLINRSMIDAISVEL